MITLKKEMVRLVATVYEPTWFHCGAERHASHTMRRKDRELYCPGGSLTERQSQ